MSFSRTWFMLLFVSFSLQAEEPSIALGWRTLKLADMEKREAQKDQTHQEGSVHIQLLKPYFDYKLARIRIENGYLRLQGARLELGFAKAIGTNVAILDVPDVSTSGGLRVGTKRVRTETEVFNFDHPILLAKEVPRTEWRLPLPEKAEFDLSYDQETGTYFWNFRDARSIILELQKGVDEAFSDQVLEATLKFDLQNVPELAEAIFKAFMGGQKKYAYAALRDMLKKEVEKPEFITRLQRDFSRLLPNLALGENEKMRGTMIFSRNEKELSRVVLGTSAAERGVIFAVDSQFVVVANAEGLGFLQRSVFLDLLKGGKIGKQIELGSYLKLDNESGQILFVLKNDREKEELASVLSSLVGEELDSKNIASVGLDIRGKFQKPEMGITDQVTMRLGLVVTPEKASDDAKSYPIEMAFSPDSSGKFVLQGIRSVTKQDAERGSSLFRNLSGHFKLTAFQFLAGEKIWDSQRDSRLFSEILKDEPRLLRIRASQ